jgi:hypothetical protein
MRTAATVCGLRTTDSGASAASTSTSTSSIIHAPRETAAATPDPCATSAATTALPIIIDVRNHFEQAIGRFQVSTSSRRSPPYTNTHCPHRPLLFC